MVGNCSNETRPRAAYLLRVYAASAASQRRQRVYRG